MIKANEMAGKRLRDANRELESLLRDEKDATDAMEEQEEKLTKKVSEVKDRKLNVKAWKEWVDAKQEEANVFFCNQLKTYLIF